MAFGVAQPVFQRKEVPESHCSQQYWIYEHYKYELHPPPHTHTHQVFLEFL